jgi:hypothetical protein
MSVIATNSKKRTALRWVLFSLLNKDKKIGQLKLPYFESKVPGRGIEPRTRGFSVQQWYNSNKHKKQISSCVYSNLGFATLKLKVGIDWQKSASI